MREKRLKPFLNGYVIFFFFQDAISNFKNALELLGSRSFSVATSFTDTTQSRQSSPEEVSEIHFLLGQCNTQLEQHHKALNAYNHALKVRA